MAAWVMFAETLDRVLVHGFGDMYKASTADKKATMKARASSMMKCIGTQVDVGYCSDCCLKWMAGCSSCSREEKELECRILFEASVGFRQIHK